LVPITIDTTLRFFRFLLSRLQLHQAKSGQHSYPNNIVFNMVSKQHRRLLYIATVILDVLCPALTSYLTRTSLQKRRFKMSGEVQIRRTRTPFARSYLHALYVVRAAYFSSKRQAFSNAARFSYKEGSGRKWKTSSLGVRQKESIRLIGQFLMQKGTSVI
jgi:hypothetical protein